MTSIVSDQLLSEIERGLAFVVRYGNLPRVRERLAARAGVSIDASGYAVLSRAFEEGPSRLSDLAAVLGVDVSTLSRQVQRLATAGFLRRTTDPDDGRAARLVLTAEGKRTVDKLRQARLRSLAAIVEDWSEEDLDTFSRLLGRFGDRLMEMSAR